MSALSSVMTVVGTLAALFGIVKYVLLCVLRLDDPLGQAAIRALSGRARKCYIVSQEISLRDVKSMPRLFSALFWDRGVVGYLSSELHQSDLNRFSSYHVCRVVCPRLLRKRMIRYLKAISEPREGGIAVTLVGHAQEDFGLGFVDESKVERPLLDPEEYLDIEEAVAYTLKSRGRLGLFLYGPPGTGKTSFIRYLAVRFALPINVIAFTPDIDNRDILKTFSRIPRDSIALMEDVDGYMRGRRIEIGVAGQAKFSFDAIANAIDGVYRDFAGNVVVMTANDISGIDPALIDRKGRFAFVRRFRDPSFDRRREFFADDEIASLTVGMNIDRCYFVRQHVSIFGRERTVELLKRGDASGLNKDHRIVTTQGTSA